MTTDISVALFRKYFFRLTVMLGSACLVCWRPDFETVQYNLDGTSSTREVKQQVMIPESNKSLDLYCEWTGDSLDDCFNLFHYLTRSATMWYFLGDSTMHRILKSFVKEEKKLEIIKVAKKLKQWRANLMPYYGMKQQNVIWVPPNRTRGEGPCQFGELNPFHTDCAGCTNHLLRLTTQKGGNEGGGSLVEFMAVEFARDVEFPTHTTITTQETVAKYMGRRTHGKPPRESTVCIASTGLHDMAIIPPISIEVYVQNVLDYQTLLQLHCSQVVWISLNAVEGGQENIGYAQHNEKIAKWNNAVREAMSEGITYFDIFNKSLHTKHQDNIHLDLDMYYKPLSDMLWSLMTSNHTIASES